MPFTKKWFNEEHTIILTSLVGKWTWDEVWESYRQSLAMTKDLNYKVDTIIDFTHSTQLPPIASLTQGRLLADNANPQRGMVILVKASRWIKAMAKVFFFFYPASAAKYPFEFADTVAEAEARLSRYRERCT